MTPISIIVLHYTNPQLKWRQVTIVCDEREVYIGPLCEYFIVITNPLSETIVGLQSPFVAIV